MRTDSEYATIKQNLINALDDVPEECDTSVVKKIIDEHPEVVKQLVNATDKDNKPLFTAAQVDEVLYQCSGFIQNSPNKVLAVLNNPEERGLIAWYNCGGAGLMRCLYEPLDSTVEKNLEVFGLKKTKLSEFLAEAYAEIISKNTRPSFYSDLPESIKMSVHKIHVKRKYEGYFKKKEDDFVKGNSDVLARDGVSVYADLEKKGIIDKEGYIVDVKALLKPSVIHGLSEKLHPVLAASVNYFDAPIVEDMKMSSGIVDLSKRMESIQYDDKMRQEFNPELFRGPEPARFDYIGRNVSASVFSSTEKEEDDNKGLLSSLKGMASKSVSRTRGKGSKNDGNEASLSSLKMDVSKILAQAYIEITGESSLEVIKYFRDIEDKFQTREFSIYDSWTKYGVDEYDKLKKTGIIDDEGRILNVQAFLRSSLVKATPRTFRPAGSSEVILAEAPIIKKMKDDQDPPPLPPGSRPGSSCWFTKSSNPPKKKTGEKQINQNWNWNPDWKPRGKGNGY